MWLLLKLYPDLPGNNELTLDVRGPSYLLDSRSISWLLMPWLLASPGHQHPWYWPCRIGRSVPYLRKDFNYLCHINVEEWHKMWIYVYVPSRARINSWIELELIINSIQFSMNWIGIELKDFELELNWNWKPQLIGIDQFSQFIFNSTPHFTRLNFFVCHIMEIVVWQAIPCEQAYPNAPLCVPSMWSAGVFGHQGMTIISITRDIGDPERSPTH